MRAIPLRWLSAVSFVLLPLAAARGQDALPEWLQELKQKKDDADVKLVQKIGNVGTREAAVGLIEAFDAMQSILMRREIARTLGKFTGAADAEQPSMQKLCEIAGNCEDQEVRDVALRGLGGSSRIGKQFLRQLVESQASEEVREQAMRLHLKLATADDADWYRYVWNLKAEQRKDQKGGIQPPESNVVRECAFDGLKELLSEDELIECLRREYHPKIRRAALQAMDQRDLPKAAEMAEWVLGRVDFPGADRAAAARILLAREGDKAVTRFLELVKKRDVTPDDLRAEMARLIVKSNDSGINKRVARLIGKGKPHEKVFALLATVHLDDPKVVAQVRKELGDKEQEVRAAAAAVLGQRRDEASEPELRKLLASKVPGDQRIAIDAISAIENGARPWLQELTELAKAADRDVRNAALEQLCKREDPKFLLPLSNALEHDDWTTRLLAIDGLAAMRDKAVVPKLIDRLGKEGGRMRKAVAEALWQLTGQPFDEDQKQWQSWWQAEGATFAVIGKNELAEAARRREQARLMQRTRSGARFFGIKVESHRVIFIIDVSGSMSESVYGRTFDGHGASRMEVAKQELVQCIQNLEPGSLFNILAFSNGVARWFDGRISDSNSQSRQAAITWIDRLGAMGGTNLFDSIATAFEDQDVDTICILSDGEPNMGDEIDPSRIRAKVAFWNQHRRIKINTIAVGGNFEVLEWLAQDSGGKHVQIR